MENSYRPPEPGLPVILANGTFPRSAHAIEYLRSSELVICCDGAVDRLMRRDIEPAVIVGDMDSISGKARTRYGSRLVEDADQETNDLTKAIDWAVSRNLAEVLILGADGKRIDHTIANAALLAEHCDKIGLTMVTDDGLMVPITGSTRFLCSPGQQISIFSLEGSTAFRSTGLKYELRDRTLAALWSGSLNEATSESFTLEFESGLALVFLHHP